MSFIRVKWLGKKDRKRPYRYEVESYRDDKKRPRQRFIRYVGAGVPAGWHGKPPKGADPSWRKLSIKELSSEADRLYKKDITTFDVDGLKIPCRKGPTTSLANGHKVEVYADKDFFKSGMGKAAVADSTTEIDYSLRRLPPGFVSNGTDRVVLSTHPGHEFEVGDKTHISGATYFRYEKMVVIWGIDIGKPMTYKEVDNYIPHEVGHGFYNHVEGEVNRRIDRIRVEMMKAQEEYDAKNPNLRDEAPDDYWEGIEAIGEKYSKKMDLSRQRSALYSFGKWSIKEGGISSYSDGYLATHKRFNREAKRTDKEMDKERRLWNDKHNDLIWERQKSHRRLKDLHGDGAGPHIEARDKEINRSMERLLEDHNEKMASLHHEHHHYAERAEFYRHRYINENFAESIATWYGAGTRYWGKGHMASDRARTYPRTYKNFMKIAAKESKGWAVPVKDRPPSADEILVKERKRD